MDSETLLEYLTAKAKKTTGWDEISEGVLAREYLWICKARAGLGSWEHLDTLSGEWDETIRWEPLHLNSSANGGVWEVDINRAYWTVLLQTGLAPKIKNNVATFEGVELWEAEAMGELKGVRNAIWGVMLSEHTHPTIRNVTLARHVSSVIRHVSRAVEEVAQPTYWNTDGGRFTYESQALLAKRIIEQSTPYPLKCRLTRVG
jgi:hypothetical protein